MTPQEKAQLNELLRWKRDMEAASSIPLKNHQALKANLKLESLKVIGTGNANADTQTTFYAFPVQFGIPAGASGTVIFEDSEGNTYELLKK